jgi:hypothetical protein
MTMTKSKMETLKKRIEKDCKMLGIEPTMKSEEQNDGSFKLYIDDILIDALYYGEFETLFRNTISCINKFEYDFYSPSIIVFY